MRKSKQYKLDREYNCYQGWHRQGLEKAPIRFNFWKIALNTAWQFAAWCVALALSISLLFFGINGLFNGDVYRLFITTTRITWIPYATYSIYWGFRMADIVIYDRINYPKFVKRENSQQEE